VKLYAVGREEGGIFKAAAPFCLPSLVIIRLTGQPLSLSQGSFLIIHVSLPIRLKISKDTTSKSMLYTHRFIGILKVLTKMTL
jgi:hypothetical protein